METLDIDQSLRGYRFETWSGSWSPEDAIVFAVASGAQPTHDLDFLLASRGPKTLPLLPFGVDARNQSWGIPPEDRTPGMAELLVPPGESLLFLRNAIRMSGPLPSAADYVGEAEIIDVWDKGSSAVIVNRARFLVDGVEFMSCENMFMFPGRGGFGGERGPSRNPGPGSFEDETPLRVPAESPYLFQVVGDRTDHNVDPAAAKALGFPAPFAPGAINQSVAALGLTRRYAGGDHSALREMAVDFASPHFPGEELTLLSTCTDSGEILFSLRAGDREVLANGRARLD